MPVSATIPAHDQSSMASASSSIAVAMHMATRAHRSLALLGIAILAMAPVCFVLSIVDLRVLDGANLWYKPIKFQLSVGLFLITLAAMVPATSERFQRSIVGRTTIWIAIAAAVFEIVWITLRAAIGERSHYATDTTFGSTMYALMGVAATLFTATPIVISIAALRSTSDSAIPKLVSLGMLLGSLLAFVGGAAVGGMLSEDPAHYPTSDADQASRIVFVGWSLTRDDLRIAHFVGLHGLQALIALSVVLLTIPARPARLVLWLTALFWLTGIGWLVMLASTARSPFAFVTG